MPNRTPITIAQQPRYQAALNSLDSHGPSTYIELEYRLSATGMHRVVNYLQQAGMIKGQPKKAANLRVYEITDLGRKAIGHTIQPSPPMRPLVTERPTWEPSASSPIRAGAMAAYAIPSLNGRTPAHLCY